MLNKFNLNFNSYQLLYSSENEEMTPRCIWSKVKGRKNILFLFETSDELIFGSFHSVVPICTNCNIIDYNHFIFIYKDSEVFTIESRNEQMSSLNISDSNSKIIFYINGFCDIRTNGKSWMFCDQLNGFSFPDNYYESKKLNNFLKLYNYPEIYDLNFLQCYQLF